MKQVAKLGLILALICALSGLGLAAVYNKTKPIIDERAREDLLNAAKEVIPGASTIEQLEENGTPYWLGKSGSDVLGAAVQVESQGYGNSPIQMMIGVNTEAAVTKVKIVSMSETPGIGTRIKDEAFLSRFKGENNPARVDGISGATVSSGAVKAGVSKAYDFLTAIVAPGDAVHLDITSIPDGIYEGTGEGLFGAIQVVVTVQSGKITGFEVLSHSETQGLSDPAITRIPAAIIETQKFDVDTISGATFTSKGIIDAGRDALKQFVEE